MNYKVLIVDDHPLYRAALKGAIAAASTDCEFLEADSVAGLFDALERDPQTDLLLLDLNLPGAYGFSALAHMRGSHPALPVIVVSAMDDRRTVRQALAFGAQGFVSKSADAATIGQNVLAALRGELVTPAGMGLDAEPAADPAALDVAQRMAQLTPQQFRVYGMLETKDPATGRMNEWYNGTKDSSPFVRAAKLTVNTDIGSVLPISATSWQVDWEETTRDRDGGLIGKPVHMRAMLTVYILPPSTHARESDIQRNPLGIYIRDFNWEEV